jgi:hypothetical protein
LHVKSPILSGFECDKTLSTIPYFIRLPLLYTPDHDGQDHRVSLGWELGNDHDPIDDELAVNARLLKKGNREQKESAAPVYQGSRTMP